MTRLEQIQEAIKEFDRLQNKYRKFGAYDTEPDAVFQELLVDAFNGDEVLIPQNGEKWELYLDMNCIEAANALHDGAKKVVDLICSCPLSESKEIREYLKNYCWRCNHD